MKKYIITASIGALLILSLVILSACVYPFKTITDSINSQQNLNENHYLNNPDINNPNYYYNENNLNNADENCDEDNEQTETIPETDNNNSQNDENTLKEENKLPAETELEVDKNIKEGRDILIKALVNLNIRSNPSATSTKVGSIIPNAIVPFVAQTNAYWYETIYKGKKAYISKSYSELVYFDKASPIIEKVIDEAKNLLGYPYIYGAQRYHWGNGKINTNFVMGEFDCSSLTQYAYYKGANILLDLTTRTQVYQGSAVQNKNDIKRGDLIFFTNSSRRYLTENERIGHVAIYLGDNYILHTASTYAIIEPISSRRWNDYITSRRFF